MALFGGQPKQKLTEEDQEKNDLIIIIAEFILGMILLIISAFAEKAKARYFSKHPGAAEIFGRKVAEPVYTTTDATTAGDKPTQEANH